MAYGKRYVGRSPDEVRPVIVRFGTVEAEALAAFLKAKRPPSIARQFDTGGPHTVPAFWITEGMEILNGGV